MHGKFTNLVIDLVFKLNIALLMFAFLDTKFDCFAAELPPAEPMMKGIKKAPTALALIYETNKTPLEINECLMKLSSDFLRPPDSLPCLESISAFIFSNMYLPNLKVYCLDDSTSFKSYLQIIFTTK